MTPMRKVGFAAAMLSALLTAIGSRSRARRNDLPRPGLGSGDAGSQGIDRVKLGAAIEYLGRGLTSTVHRNDVHRPQRL